MEPGNLRFGGGASDTLLHPVVALALLVAIILVFCLPRKRVIVPLLLMMFLIPRGQVVVLAGTHFTIARILIVTGLVRWAFSGQSGRLVGGFNRIDRTFTLLSLCYMAVFSLQWMQSQALIKSLGDLLDALGGYFVLRFVIHDRTDIIRAIKVLAVVAMVTAPLMVNEQISHKNIFGLLGGVANVPAVRDGQVRSQGAFAVYITAGVFGASLIPLCIWLWTSGGSRVLAALGAISGTVMTMTSHSSTPLLAYAFGLVGLAFWPFRNRMRLFRWGIVLVLAALQLSMKAPFWALIARIDLTGSSSGYQRYQLIDTCIRHFWDWWLLGARNYDAWGFNMWDLSNQYVAYAVTGGLLSIVLFIGVISRSFSRLGTARKRIAGNRKQEWFLWCLAGALLAHVTAYFGIGYFDQMQFAWYALLAMISVAGSEVTALASRSRTLTRTFLDGPPATLPVEPARLCDNSVLQVSRDNAL
jgi:hypothetical protein